MVLIILGLVGGCGPLSSLGDLPTDTGTGGTQGTGSGEDGGTTTDTSDVPDPPPTESGTDSDPGTSGTETPVDPCGDPGVPGSQCDLWSESCPVGCKCMPWDKDGGSSWNATRCSPLDPNPKGPGQPCTVEGYLASGVDDCAKHSMCWDPDPETNEGTCVPFCLGTADDPSCSDECSTCVIGNGGILTLCLPVCDPLVQDCPAQEGCYPVEDAFVCAPDASEGSGKHGDPCDFTNDCDPGLACLEIDAVAGCAGTVGCCTSFCAPLSPCPDEDLGMQCVDWFDGPPPNPCQHEVGICRLPP